ncbi:MAG TPA: M28 family metallopeptidase, partial [Candidatus Thermoplasmatota archaeon]|nr:M28 family metallopeptidase [Candidatus Thermoplasmatota archaeon]
MKASTAVAVLLAAGLAGCAGETPHAPPSTTGAPTTDVPPAFDGEAALAFVKAVALQPDGSPRFRIPGTQGQLDGAAALWRTTAVPGWERAWQNFTGEDYLRLDRGIVAPYTPGPHVNRAYCTVEAEAKVPGLRFANLVAVRPSPNGTAPLLLLGAHWDSQMHSDNDVPTNRSKPDPGANDGASGVGVLLQLMRSLDALGPLPFSVGILFIDGEDGFYDCYPLAGSLHFAQGLQDRPGRRPAAFILLDMVGDPGALYPKESHSRSSAPDLLELLWRHGQATPYGAAHFTNQTATVQDDHLAFIKAGVPAVDIIDAGRPDVFPPQWNTAFDTVDRLDARMLGLVGATLLAALADPAL